MNLESFKRRTIRILTNPPELLYAMSKHWAILACCLSLGVMITAAKVATDPELYRGSATLIVNPQSAVVSDGRNQKGMNQGDVQRFLNTQTTLLNSRTTLSTLVGKFKQPGQIVDQATNKDADKYTGLRKFLNQGRAKLRNMMNWLETPGEVKDTGAEVVRHRAINSFLSRSEVVPRPRDNTIKLYLYGVNRELLVQELRAWIDSYRDRVEDMHEEGRTAFIANQVQQYKDREEVALKAIEDFKIKHPDVNESQRAQLAKELEQWNDMRYKLQFRLALPEELAANAAVTPTPEFPTEEKSDEEVRIRARIEQLEIEINRYMASGYTEDSMLVQRLKRQKEFQETKLTTLPGGSSIPLTPGTNEVDPHALQATLQENLKNATEKRDKILLEQQLLESDLARLASLEEDLRRAKDKRLQYEEMGSEDIDRLLELFMVKIREGDRPEAPLTPANTYPHRQVMLGSALGLFVGLALALFLEVLCGKVRYRNDVTHQFGIPVVGVIPKR